MSTRAQAVAETRARVVAAATSLHAERGLLATSWEDIAAEAGVSPATVYRHFPSVAELVPACAKSVFDVARPPTLEEAQAKFESARTISERFDQFVGDSVHCYEAGEAWLHAARRERELIPAVNEVVTIQEQAVAVLVDACLAGRKVSRRRFELLCVVCDFPFWKSLVDAGTPRRAARHTLMEIVDTVLEKEGIQ